MARDLAAIHRRLDDYEQELTAYYEEARTGQPLRLAPSSSAEAGPTPSAK